jgi:hypothetical protein
MFEYISIDFALGMFAACGIWVLGNWIYKITAKPAPLAASTSIPTVASVEAKLGSLAGAVGSALGSLRQEAQVKLSAVETSLHERVTSLETFVYGPDYSAATLAAASGSAPTASVAAPVTPAPAAPTPAAAPPHASKVPASHLAAPAHHTPASAGAVAGTAVAGVKAQAGTGSLVS